VRTSEPAAVSRRRVVAALVITGLAAAVYLATMLVSLLRP